jgi:Protein kinase domain
MGEVYLATDPRLGREVAIKVLNAQAAAAGSGRERFRNEAQMAARLDHPNICTLHEIGTDGDVDYLVMQRLHGETLADRLARGEREGQALDLAIQLTEALAYAHAQGVIHRDIKPQNVMVTPEGRVKLMDFGLAKAPGRLDGAEETRAALTVPGAFFGTLQYMSPEQLEGSAADHRSDIFSLGMVVYQLFAVKHPFAGATTAAMLTAMTLRPAPLLSETAPQAPRGLDRILAKALARDPAERYQSTADLLVDLQAVRRGTVHPAADASPTASGARSFGLRNSALVAALVLTAAGVAAVYWPRSPAAPPATSTAAPAAPIASMTTWLEIEPVRAGVPQDVYESAGGDTLADGWRLRVHVSPKAAGYLTVLSDATVSRGGLPTLTVLHPPTLRGQRSVTDWNVIDGEPSDIAIWVIWSATSADLLDGLKAYENPRDAGVVRDPQAAERLRNWLGPKASLGTRSATAGATRLTVEGSEPQLVHRFVVKH